MLKIMKKNLIVPICLFPLNLFIVTACSYHTNHPSFNTTQNFELSRFTEPKIIVIGHRGASALRPEHTLAAYQKAIEDGADFIEPDLVITRDGYLIARHENNITQTTNVSELSQFKNRKTTKIIDGEPHTGWFTEDFTLSEIKQLKARERIPNIRKNNTIYNDQFEIPTLDEIIQLTADHYKKTGKVIGLYIETKHPSYFQHINLPLEDRLLNTLEKHPYSQNISPIYLQSFEVKNLKYLHKQLNNNHAIANVQTVQLFASPTESPADFVIDQVNMTYADLATPQGLAQISEYAQGVGPSKSYIIDTSGLATNFVSHAHAQNLKVHPYTFRPENQYLAKNLQCQLPSNARCESGSIAEVKLFLHAGVDGIFIDDPKLGRQAVTAFKVR